MEVEQEHQQHEHEQEMEVDDEAGERGGRGDRARSGGEEVEVDLNVRGGGRNVRQVSLFKSLRLDFGYYDVRRD